jgi:hypothetical protein
MNFAPVKSHFRRSEVKYIGFAVGDSFSHFDKVIDNDFGEFIHLLCLLKENFKMRSGWQVSGYAENIISSIPHSGIAVKADFIRKRRVMGT